MGITEPGMQTALAVGSVAFIGAVFLGPPLDIAQIAVLSAGAVAVGIAPSGTRLIAAIVLAIVAALTINSVKNTGKEGLSNDGNCNDDSDSDSDGDDDSDSDGDDDSDSDGDDDGDNTDTSDVKKKRTKARSGTGTGSGSGKGAEVSSGPSCVLIEESLRARPSASLPVPPQSSGKAKPPAGTSNSKAVLASCYELNNKSWQGPHPVNPKGDALTPCGKKDCVACKSPVA
jgi:hypothetical protein